MPTKEELKELQSRTLDQKIMLTQTRIIEWYEHWKGQVYISFSGGKDSTVLLNIARQIYPDIEAVFLDTGLEYPEIRNFTETLNNVTPLKPKMSFKQVIDLYGYPVISKEVSQKIYEYRKNPGGCRNRQFDPNSDYLKRYGKRFSLVKYIPLRDSDIPISHMCCKIMKKDPAKAYERRTGKKPILGTLAAESALRSESWMKSGCNAFGSKRPISQPMSFWIEQDVLQYLMITETPYCSVYGDIVAEDEFIGQIAMDDVPTDLITTGCDRTGCMFCMFGVHLEKEPNRFQRMKITHPKQYDYCMREANGLGLAKVLDYIGVKY